MKGGKAEMLVGLRIKRLEEGDACGPGLTHIKGIKNKSLALKEKNGKKKWRNFM